MFSAFAEVFEFEIGCEGRGGSDARGSFDLAHKDRDCVVCGGFDTCFVGVACFDGFANS